MNTRLPIIGQWYVHRGSGRMFEVVSIDPHDGVELQDYDGNLDEVDLETWNSTALDEIDRPDDLFGVFDLDELDDADGRDDYAFAAMRRLPDA